MKELNTDIWTIRVPVKPYSSRGVQWLHAQRTKRTVIRRIHQVGRGIVGSKRLSGLTRKVPGTTTDKERNGSRGYK